jgi:hypothetical protein
VGVSSSAEAAGTTTGVAGAVPPTGAGDEDGDGVVTVEVTVIVSTFAGKVAGISSAHEKTEIPKKTIMTVRRAFIIPQL